jgi:mRNA interferase HigB
MRVVGRNLLSEFAQKHADAAAHIDAWTSEVSEAKWKTPGDVKKRYPSASILSNNRVVFNLKGNRYRVATSAHYATGVVLVDRIGTHAEYSRWIF